MPGLRRAGRSDTLGESQTRSACSTTWTLVDAVTIKRAAIPGTEEFGQPAVLATRVTMAFFTPTRIMGGVICSHPMLPAMLVTWDAVALFGATCQR